MTVRDLKYSNVFVIENEDDRLFIEDLFELEEMGEHVPILEAKVEYFSLYDDTYAPIALEQVSW